MNNSPPDIDPSLCAGEPLLDTLDDGFSPPATQEGPQPAQAPPLPAQQSPGAKSPF